MDLVEQLNRAFQGRYHVERELGRGGMARVLLARDLKHERRVAIKLLRPELSAALGVGRFLREIKTTANLTHPSILALYDSGEVDGTLFYVMPLVEGESLRERLDRGTQIPVDEALRIAGDVADALDYASARGIVHRDIKPENVLLQGGRAFVADFGVALALRGTPQQRLTDTGLAIGTLAYMSPEQLHGELLDGRSDQYALACVVWEMVGGAQPFGASTPEAIVAQKLIARSLRFTSNAARMSKDAEDVIRKALETRPEDRYPTSRAFVDALAVAMASPSGWLPRRMFRRGRVRLAIAAGMVALISGTAAWVAWPFVTEPQPDARQYVRAVAVLPFDNQTPEMPGTLIAEAVADNVIDRLSRIRSLRVVPSLQVARYRSNPQSAVDIAKELGVDAVLEGNIRQGDEGLWITAQLVDGRHGYVIWSFTSKGDGSNVFAAQDSIASGVLGTLAMETSSHELRAVHRAPTDDYAAYQLFVAGQRQLTSWSSSGMDSAVVLFTTAAERAPRFADAHAQLAFTQVTRAYFGYVPRADVLEEIRAHSDRALSLDPDNEIALLSRSAPELMRLGAGEDVGLWDLRRLIVTCRRLFDRYPESPVGNFGIAYFYLWVKEDTATAELLFRRVLANADVALQGDSTNRFIRGVAAQASGVMAQLANGRGNTKSAIELSELSLRYVPGAARTLWQLSRFYDSNGQVEKARQTGWAAAEALSENAKTGSDHVNVAMEFYVIDRMADAESSFVAGYHMLDDRDVLKDYALLYWLIVADRRGDADKPRRLARARLARQSENAWVATMLGFWLGETDERTLLEQARKNWQQCEAHYVLGARALRGGRSEDARRHFEAAVATRMTTYFEYAFAQAELARLRVSSAH